MARKKGLNIDVYDVMLFLLFIASLIITFFSIGKNTAGWQTMQILATAIMTGIIVGVPVKKLMDASSK